MKNPTPGHPLCGSVLSLGEYLHQQTWHIVVRFLKVHVTPPWKVNAWPPRSANSLVVTEIMGTHLAWTLTKPDWALLAAVGGPAPHCDRVNPLSWAGRCHIPARGSFSTTAEHAWVRSLCGCRRQAHQGRERAIVGNNEKARALRWCYVCSSAAPAAKA